MEGYNLTTLLKRLEAATSRLEDLVVVTEGNSDSLADSAQWSESTAHSPRTMSIAGATTTPRESGVATVAVNTAPSRPSHQENACESLYGLDAKLEAFVQLSKEIAPVVSEQASALLSAAKASNKVVELASQPNRLNLDPQSTWSCSRPCPIW